MAGEGPLWHKGQDLVVSPCKDNTNLLRLLFLVQNYFGHFEERVSFDIIAFFENTGYLADLFSITTIKGWEGCKIAAKMIVPKYDQLN